MPDLRSEGQTSHAACSSVIAGLLCRRSFNVVSPMGSVIRQPGMLLHYISRMHPRWGASFSWPVAAGPGRHVRLPGGLQSRTATYRLVPPITTDNPALSVSKLRARFRPLFLPLCRFSFSWTLPHPWSLFHLRGLFHSGSKLLRLSSLNFTEVPTGVFDLRLL